MIFNKRKTPTDGFSPNDGSVIAKRQKLPIHGRRFIMEVSLTWISGKGEIRSLQAKMLVDSGATGPLMSKSFITRHQLPRVQRENPIIITNASGQVIQGAGRYVVPNLGMSIGQHQEELAWEVGDIEQGVDGYLPVSWLSLHNPDIDWERKQLTWRSAYCREHCLPVNIDGSMSEFAELLEESEQPENRWSAVGHLCAVWTEPEEVQ